MVDDQDRVVGTAPRGTVLDDGMNFRTAHVLLFSADLRSLLLQRLASGRDRHAGRWGSSVAAYLQHGESYRQAAERRVQEELGIVPALEDLGTVPTRDRDSTKFVSVFSGEVGDRTVQGDGTHIDELRQWSLDEIDRTLADDPDAFTPTFRVVYARFVDRAAG